MPLASIEVNNIRVYEHSRFEPSPKLNLIVGANASGKTTLLEAIHLLGTGRSFRTQHTEQLRRNSTSDLNIAGLIRGDRGEFARLGFYHGAEGRRASINGQEQKQISGLAMQLPLQIISPDTHYEFQQNSKQRRGVLDWTLFHVEPDFTGLWSRYQRILQQRNTALKDARQTKTRHIWDDELIDAGEQLHAVRQNLTTQLLPYYQNYCQHLLGENSRVELELDPGWGNKTSFGDRLQQDRFRDSTRGFTHSGPQRADLHINLNNQASKLTASHGQYKALVIALRLAQIHFLLESKKQKCCLLIDDLAAELDHAHRGRLSGVLASLPIQIFVTATEQTLIDCGSWSEHRTFHVEQGAITSLD